jgi:AraC-like DNA-binding protein
MADQVRTWLPDLPDVRSVLHAVFEQHAYPVHTHDDWTVLLVDEGAVSYDLARRSHRAQPSSITLLPPDVPHDGRSATRGVPFRKRVLYMDRSWLPARWAQAAIERPEVGEVALVRQVAAVHRDLVAHGAEARIEDRLHRLRETLLLHLGVPTRTVRDAPLAAGLRALLDDRLAENVTMAEAGRLLGAHPSHLIRTFSQAYGISPHRYVVGRRVDLARRLLLAGRRSADVAVEAGFHDQAHLTRHVRRVLGLTPGMLGPSARREGVRA